jgi:O-antigen/teichoic acid export membrane protein
MLDEALRTVTSRQGIRQVLRTPLYANALYVTLSAAVSGLLGFLFWLIVARFYSTEVVGYSSAIISALNLLAWVGLIGLDMSLVRFLPHVDSPRRMINTCLTVASFVSLVVAGIFLAGLRFWSPALSFIRENAVFCLAFLLFAVTRTLSLVIDSAFLAGRRAGFTLLRNTIFSLLRLPLPVLFALHFRTFGVVSSFGIALAISVALAMFVFLPRVRADYRPAPVLDLGLIKEQWWYSSRSYLSNLLMEAPAYVLPLMVVNRLGAEQNAYFYIAWMIASLLFAVPLGASQSLFAEGSHFEDRLRENVVKSLKSTFLLLVPLAILAAAAGKWLLLVFGQAYSLNALALLWVMCLSSLPMGVTYIYTGVLRVVGRVIELVVMWVFVVSGTLVGSYLLLPLTGIVGIGYAWLGVHLIVMIYVLAGRKLVPAVGNN